MTLKIHLFRFLKRIERKKERLFVYCLLWKSRNTLHYTGEWSSEPQRFGGRLLSYKTKLSHLTIISQFLTQFCVQSVFLIVDISSSETTVSKNMPSYSTICPDAISFNRDKNLPFHNSEYMAEHEHTLREGGVRILIHLKWWKTDVKHFPIATFDRRR